MDLFSVTGLRPMARWRGQLGVWNNLLYTSRNVKQIRSCSSVYVVDERVPPLLLPAVAVLWTRDVGEQDRGRWRG
jgi:hypothetical protein